MCGEPTAPADRITPHGLEPIDAEAAGLPAPADAVGMAGRQVVDVLAILDPHLLAGLDHGRSDRRPIDPSAHKRCEVAAFKVSLPLRRGATHLG